VTQASSAAAFLIFCVRLRPSSWRAEAPNFIRFLATRRLVDDFAYGHLDDGDCRAMSFIFCAKICDFSLPIVAKPKISEAVLLEAKVLMDSEIHLWRQR
jgi:hypothetical protein